MPIIQAENLTKVYGRGETAVTALDHVRLSVEPGEVVAVMGRAVGVWWLNACRVVYLVDESGPVSKFGP